MENVDKKVLFLFVEPLELFRIVQMLKLGTHVFYLLTLKYVLLQEYLSVPFASTSNVYPGISKETRTWDCAARL